MHEIARKNKAWARSLMNLVLPQVHARSQKHDKVIFEFIIFIIVDSCAMRIEPWTRASTMLQFDAGRRKWLQV